MAATSRGDGVAARSHPAIWARGRLIFVLYWLGSLLAPKVPLSIAYTLLDLLGDLTRLLNRSGRRAVEVNLRQVIGDDHRRWRRAVRGVFRHGARNYYDTFRLPALSTREIRQLVPVRGWEHLDRALAAGNGAILAGAHLSSVSLAAQAVVARGHVLHVAVEPVDPPELLQLLTRLRGGIGMRPVPLGPDLATQLLAALRRNEVVALAADRDVAGNGVMVPFFGRPARLPSGPALLALRGDVPILPAIAVRRRDGRFDGVIEAPIQIQRTRNLRCDLLAITAAVTARLEYYIHEYPEQWTVFQPVWPEVGVGDPRSGTLHRDTSRPLLDARNP